MDPILLQVGPLAIRWYGLLIALGAILGVTWGVRVARRRGIDPEPLYDMAPWLVVGGLLGARAVFVATSPHAILEHGGTLWDAFAIWKGGGSIHGGVLGVGVAAWIYARRHRLDTWRYLDLLTPVGAFGIIGGRIGNIMNGDDTTGRLTGLPIGVTWPEPGTATFGSVGRFLFGDDMWSAYSGTCDLGSDVAWSQCAALGGTIVRGPVHFTQFYGILVGVVSIPVLWWAFRRVRPSGFVFWQFVLWYSILRAVIEEPFRDNPLAIRVVLSEGPDGLGVGLFTLTQLASFGLIALSWAVLARMNRTRGTPRTGPGRAAAPAPGPPRASDGRPAAVHTTFTKGR